MNGGKNLESQHLNPTASSLSAKRVVHRGIGQPHPAVASPRDNGGEVASVLTCFAITFSAPNRARILSLTPRVGRVILASVSFSPTPNAFEGACSMKFVTRLVIFLALFSVPARLGGQERSEPVRFFHDIVIESGERAGDAVCFGCSIYV